ncbi:MAG TPA: hypothetical protein PLI57_09065, partial [Spirochaetota bacterium]|nr:hypothetical protein [Spirochaetota bacterium]
DRADNARQLSQEKLTHMRRVDKRAAIVVKKIDTYVAIFVAGNIDTYVAGLIAGNIDTYVTFFVAGQFGAYAPQARLRERRKI